MKTPGELAATHTGLDAATLDHLQRLLGSWGVLSDLSFSDLLLVAPVRGTAGSKLIVLGQIRPTTWATLLRVDLVGQVVESSDWPVVTEAIQAGTMSSGLAVIPVPVRVRLASGDPDSRDTGEVPAVPDTAQLECVPVRHGGDPVAVVVRVAPLEDRRPGRLERVYRDLYRRLAHMVAVGDFPFMGEDFTTEDAPRVGDGLVLVEPDGQVRYASPNAMSALHRMGVSDVVEGRRLSELGIDDAALDWALRAGCPVTEEVERRPDVIVLMQCTPLLEQETVTGAMVLLRDVTDLRRLDRLLLSKDAAIREVHHRVKNNLQTISSLLRLQARRLEPGKGQEALREAERRVRSIALVHEILSVRSPETRCLSTRSSDHWSGWPRIPWCRGTVSGSGSSATWARSPPTSPLLSPSCWPSCCRTPWNTPSRRSGVIRCSSAAPRARRSATWSSSSPMTPTT